MRTRNFLAVSLSAFLLSTGISVSTAQGAVDIQNSGLSPRTSPTQPPKGVEFLSSVPNRKQLAEGMPIRVRYLGDAKSKADGPAFFALYTLNSYSGVFEVRAMPLSACGQATKKFGTRCIFFDLPDYWDKAAKDADRIGVRAGNSKGFGPMGTIAGTWLADSAAVAECIISAGQVRGKEIKLSLAGAVGGAITGLIPVPGLNYLTGPLVEAGVSTTVDFAISKDLRQSAETFITELGLNGGERTVDAVLKSESAFIKAINSRMKGKLPKGAKGLAAVAGGVLVIKDYKDTYENFYVDKRACIG